MESANEAIATNQKPVRKTKRERERNVNNQRNTHVMCVYMYIHQGEWLQVPYTLSIFFINNIKKTFIYLFFQFPSSSFSYVCCCCRWMNWYWYTFDSRQTVIDISSIVNRCNQMRCITSFTWLWFFFYEAFSFQFFGSYSLSCVTLIFSDSETFATFVNPTHFRACHCGKPVKLWHHAVEGMLFNCLPFSQKIINFFSSNLTIT